MTDAGHLSTIEREELGPLIRSVVQEVRGEFASDQWALLLTERTAPILYAAAGLSHCCVLGEELIAAHERGAELIGRIIARSLFECWLISYYTHLGGYAALTAVAAAYHDSLKRRHHSIQQHDATLVRRRRSVRKRNRKIATTNEGIITWNRRNPTCSPKPLLTPLPEPPGIIIGDSNEWIKHVPQVAAAPLALTKVIDRVRALTRDAGEEESFEASYHLAYRGLSGFGAHANLFVLDSYLDDRSGHANFVRVRPNAVVPSSFDEPNLRMALLLTSGLSARILGDRGGQSVVARNVLTRFNLAVSKARDGAGTAKN